MWKKRDATKYFLFQVTLRELGTDFVLSMGKMLELSQCSVHGVVDRSISVVKV